MDLSAIGYWLSAMHRCSHLARLQVSFGPSADAPRAGKKFLVVSVLADCRAKTKLGVSSAFLGGRGAPGQNKRLWSGPKTCDSGQTAMKQEAHPPLGLGACHLSHRHF